MTLQQLALIKRWHVQHRHRHPVEFQAWDALLTAWMLGWIGAPAALILDAPGAMGEAGVARCLEIIRNELDLTMAFCGRTNIEQVDRDVLLAGTY